MLRLLHRWEILHSAPEKKSTGMMTKQSFQTSTANKFIVPEYHNGWNYQNINRITQLIICGILILDYCFPEFAVKGIIQNSCLRTYANLIYTRWQIIQL